MRVVLWIVYAIFLLTQGFIAYHFIRTSSKMYLKSTLTCNALFALYVIADAVFKIGVPYWTRILVITALFIHTFFGYYKDRYTLSKIFDRCLHVYGSIAFALFPYEILICLIKPSVSPKIYEAVFVFALGITVGTLFEIFEFFVDKKLHKNTTQPGLKDTDVDMICNVIGSLIAAIAAYLFIL